MSFPPYPVYKASGSDWLGKVPEHWDVALCKRFITVKSGDMISATEESDHGFPLIGGNGIRAHVAKWNTRGDTLVIGRVGALCGCVHHIREDFWATEHAFRVVEKQRLSKRFFFHLLSALELNRYAIKTAQPLLNTEIVETQWISVPPISEQNLIAEFLDGETEKIDELVTEQQRLIELLGEKRRAIISHAVTKGLNRRALVKPSGIEWLGDIPEHWKVMHLRRLVKLGTTITYGIVQAGPDIDGGIPYIRTSDMAGALLPETGYLRTTPEIDLSYARSKVKPNDLVVAIRASLGKGMLVPDFLDGANLTQGTARICPGESLIPRFLLWAFNSSYCQTNISVVAKGTTFLEITLDALRRIPLAMPPLPEQSEIVDYLDRETEELDALIAEAEYAIDLLQERRAVLVSASVTGKIDVRGLAQTAIA